MEILEKVLEYQKLSYPSCFYSTKYESFENYLFTGDTMIKDTKPVLKKRYGASKTELRQTINAIFSKFPEKTIVFPGHGDCFLLYETKQFYISYFEKHG